MKIAFHIVLVKTNLEEPDFYLAPIKTHYSEHQLGKWLPKPQNINTFFYKLQNLYNQRLYTQVVVFIDQQ